MDFRTESVINLAKKVEDKEISPSELVQFALDKIEELNPKINAFIAVDGDFALSEARELDKSIARGDLPGPLAGIPIGVKDMEDAKNFVTSKGSALFASTPKQKDDSILVSRLKSAGCIVVGKTNTPELAWKADTVNSTFGPTLNPWNTLYSPGGSSGGSAAAVSSGMVPLATGSDGGGSLRIPSAACGISAFKPSLGRIPAGGSSPPEWHDLSTKGVMAKSLNDIVAVIDCVVGPDPSDLYSLPTPDATWVGALNDAHVANSIAYSTNLGYADVDSEIVEICDRAVEVLVELGANADSVEGIFDEDPINDWLSQVAVYSWNALEPYADSPEFELVDELLKSLSLWGKTLTASDLKKSQDQGHIMNLKLVNLFHHYRLLVTPTVAGHYPLSNGLGTINGVQDINWVKFTYPFNLTRSPVATVPIGFTNAGLPISLQIIGPQHGDQVVIRTAYSLEKALENNKVAPC